jgi:hypothetical protein
LNLKLTINRPKFAFGTVYIKVLTNQVFWIGDIIVTNRPLRSIGLGFVLTVLVFSCSVNALTYRYWDGGGLGDLWTVPENWEGDSLPNSSHAVVIDNASVGQPYITSGINRVHTQVAIGNGQGPCVIYMDGGSLRSTGNFNLAQSSVDGHGTLNLSGGTVTVEGVLNVGITGSGIIEMSGGTLNANRINMGYSNKFGSYGRINLAGGTIYVQNRIIWYNIESAINICGGSLVLSGNMGEESARWGREGLLLAYGEVAPEKFYIDYDPVTDTTTVTATETLDINKAHSPSPVHFAETATVTPDTMLSWGQAELAVSYDIYLGQDKAQVLDADINSAEFCGNTANLYYDPQGLTPGKVYYWRVDAVQQDGTVIKGDMWQFRVRIPAFPGAEGAGAYTVGGRGGRVIEVTNLNDSGPGSFREALEATGPRNVIFKVSGTIELQDNIYISSPYITIAGQTAPGDGICIKNWSIFVDADQVIIRHIRVRPGDILPAGAVYKEVRAIRVGSRNVIIDHVSTSWCTDQTLDVIADNANGGNVTIQWCMVTESLNDSVHTEGPHGCASLIRSAYGAEVSWHHNLYAHNDRRGPDLAPALFYQYDPEGWYFDFRNNVIYNWMDVSSGRNLSFSTNGNDGRMYINFVNNYYLSGVNTPTPYLAYRTGNKNCRGYFGGNYINGILPADPWSLVSFYGTWWWWDLAAYKQSVPFDIAQVTTEPATTAYQRVLAEAGATLPKRDSVDERVLFEVANLGGRIIDSQNEVGGWPTLSSATGAADSDHDGMSDYWEVQKGLNPNNPADGPEDADNDGYTNLEEYFEYLREPVEPGLKASDPSPAHQATDVYLENTLSWQSEPGVISHDVYFGNTNPPAFQGNRTGSSFEIGSLTPNTVYYWRIDDLYGDKRAEGDVWSFTTIGAVPADYVLTDDYEDGNYTANPQWTILTDQWEVVQETVSGGVNHYLRMKNTAATDENGQIYASFNPITDGKFEVTMRIKPENTTLSSTNYQMIYIGDYSSWSNPAAAYYNNSYFVQIINRASVDSVQIKKWLSTSTTRVTLAQTSEYAFDGSWVNLKFTYDSSLVVDNLKLYIGDMQNPFLTATDDGTNEAPLTAFDYIALYTRRSDDYPWGIDDINIYSSYEVLVSPEYADLDDSGLVNVADFSTIAKYWLWDCTNPHEVEKADINRSGEVDLNDLSIMADNWLLMF